MRVLVAFDKFKDSISARKACDIAAASIASAHIGCESDRCPLSDGGEGFMEILTSSAGGTETRLEVDGPRGAKVTASFGMIPISRIPPGARAWLDCAAGAPDGWIAVVEMASASGLALVDTAMRDPLKATSIGTGQLIRAASEAGARAILLGVGGSATHDLGLGALGALGIRYLGAGGSGLGPLIPGDWHLVRSIAGRLPVSMPPILIACDVDNPLLGPRGALSVYGPQKGLARAAAADLEAESARMAAMLGRHFGRADDLAATPGAGAAGGIAFGLMAAAGATLLPGFELVASWLDLDRRVAAADLVLTGEGCFDETSLSGKGPGSLVRRALAQGKAVHVFAGEVTLGKKIPGLSTHVITPSGTPLAEALAEAPAFLSEAVSRAFADR
jgi:glycerate kinase